MRLQRTGPEGVQETGELAQRGILRRFEQQDFRDCKLRHSGYIEIKIRQEDLIPLNQPHLEPPLTSR